MNTQLYERIPRNNNNNNIRKKGKEELVWKESQEQQTVRKKKWTNLNIKGMSGTKIAWKERKE